MNYLMKHHGNWFQYSQYLYQHNIFPKQDFVGCEINDIIIQNFDGQFFILTPDN